MTRPPRKPSSASAREAFRPFVRVGVGLVVTLLLIGLAFAVLPRLQQSPLRDPVVRLILRNRSDRPLANLRLARCDDGSLLAAPPDVAHGDHFVMERPLGDELTYRISFDQLGARHTFDGLVLRPAHAELSILTVTPGPCINGRPADATERR